MLFRSSSGFTFAVLRCSCCILVLSPLFDLLCNVGLLVYLFVGEFFRSTFRMLEIVGSFNFSFDLQVARDCG